jgi:hypothetical protein
VKSPSTKQSPEQSGHDARIRQQQQVNGPDSADPLAISSRPLDLGMVQPTRAQQSAQQQVIIYYQYPYSCRSNSFCFLIYKYFL